MKPDSNTNILLATEAGLDKIAPISAERHNATMFGERLPLTDRQFKYQCGVIVDIEEKKVYYDMTAEGNVPEVKRVIDEVVKAGYKYV